MSVFKDSINLGASGSKTASFVYRTGYRPTARVVVRDTFNPVVQE